MKRILHVAVTLTGEGIANYLYNYLTHIDLKKYKIDIVINKDSKDGIYEEELREKGINIIKVFSYEDSTKKWAKEIENIMKENKYDICEFHVGIRSNILCKLAYKNNIKTRIIHTHIAFEPEKPLKKIIRKIYNCLYFKYVTNYFGCSEDSLVWTFGSLTKKRKCYVINNAVDTKKFKYDIKIREKYRNEFGLNNCFVIGCVGRLCFQKNQLFLIEIFKELIKIKVNSKLVIIGDGPDKLQIEKKIDEYKLQEDVILTGIRSDVNCFLNAFDAFVLPSRYEGFGIVYLEAELNNLCCFGTKERVPKNVKISDNMHFISERKTAQEWAKIICDKTVDRDKHLNNNYIDFDINEQAKVLDRIYKEI